MAVYEHAYRRYSGELASRWQRFLVVPRYAAANLWQSRGFLIFYLLCWLQPFVGMILLYLRHNVGVLKLFGATVERIQQVLPIDGAFFNRGMEGQAFLSFILAVAIGPALISPDLRNNGLALYLARPFSRLEYVLGKLVVLLALMASITLLPGLLLFAFQAYLEGGSWVSNNLSVLAGVLIGGGTWIIAAALLTLAVSAWVKWRPVARIVLLIVYFVMSVFANITEKLVGTWWGSLLSISQVCSTITAHLFAVRPPSELPLAAAWFAVIAGSLACFALLMRRIRAYEVVR